MNKLLNTTLIAVSLAAMTASVAIAETNATADRPFTRAPHHRLMGRPFSRPTERAEARLAYIRTALKITDAQQPQWDAYATFVRGYARDMEKRFQARRSSEADYRQRHRLNAIERLERTQSFMANAITRINQLLAVEKPLYAALSPKQQRVADVVLKPHVPPMREHRRGGFGRG